MLEWLHRYIAGINFILPLSHLQTDQHDYEFALYLPATKHRKWLNQNKIKNNAEPESYN